MAKAARRRPPGKEAANEGSELGITLPRRALNAPGGVCGGQRPGSPPAPWSELFCTLRPTNAKRISATRTFLRNHPRFWIASSRSSSFPRERAAGSRRCPPARRGRVDRRRGADQGEPKWRRGERVLVTRTASRSSFRPNQEKTTSSGLPKWVVTRVLVLAE